MAKGDTNFLSDLNESNLGVKNLFADLGIFLIER